MTLLRSLYMNHQGKVSDKWSHYLNVYEQYFSCYQHRPIRLLEIGIQNGGSLEVWSQYFKHADLLVGCDINPDCVKLKYDDSRIAVVVADANTSNAESEITAYSTSYDIVIDDGSHRSGDIIRSFFRYFKYLNDDGLFVIEDLHCSYWLEFGGGCYDPYSAIAFFKKLIDITNFEHWGVNVSRVDFLNDFAQKYDIFFTEDLLATIYSVDFSNSLCFIRKRIKRQGCLGKRVVAGKIAEIVPSIVGMEGTLCPKVNQENTVWGADQKSVEQRYFLMLQELNKFKELVLEQETRIFDLREIAKEKDACITDLRQVVDAKDACITDLGQVVDAKDACIIDLGQVVDAKDACIIDLRQVVEAKDACITDLRQVVDAKDACIIDLRQVVEAKDACITDLRQVVEAKDACITDLRQVVEAKDACIIDLRQVVEAKDACITDLRQVVEAKDTCITDLSQLVEESNDKIRLLVNEVERYKDSILQVWTTMRAQ